MIFYSDPKSHKQFALNPARIVEAEFTPGLVSVLWIKLDVREWSDGAEETHHKYQEKRFTGELACALWVMMQHPAMFQGQATHGWGFEKGACPHHFETGTDQEYNEWSHIMTVRSGEFCTKCGVTRNIEVTEYTPNEEEVAEYYA